MVGDGEDKWVEKEATIDDKKLEEGFIVMNSPEEEEEEEVSDGNSVS
jgi:hypothetical protein